MRMEYHIKKTNNLDERKDYTVGKENSLEYSGGVRGVQVVQLHHSILRKLHNSKAIAPLDLRTLKC